jgi:hypothetical protein
MQFQLEKKAGWIRPTYGGQLEFNFGGNRLYVGEILGGVHLMAPEMRYVKPFIEASGILGWAHFSTPTTGNLGAIFGFLISVGTDLCFSKKETSTGFRLLSSWRIPFGSIGGGLSGSDLSAFQLSIGHTF